MEHTIQGTLRDYWTKMEQHSTPFYGQTRARDRYYHILRFLHYKHNNRNGVDRTDERLWKLRNLFEIIRTKFYNPSEHLAIDEVIVKFKGRVLFKQYIPTKRKRFGVKMFKICDSTGYIYIYIYDMNVDFGKDRQRAEQHLTAKRRTMTSLTKMVEGFVHKPYWTASFPPRTSTTTWPRNIFYVVGELGHVGKTCPRSLGPGH
jgi:hypothetical protein